VSNELLIGILMALAVIAVVVGAMAAYFRTFRSRSATSPETSRPAIAAEAAHSTGEGDQRAPTRKTAFRTMTRWYAGKRCAMCGRDIAPLSHFGPEPGLMSAASPTVSIAWTDVPSERLTTMLDTHLPVCSSCHLINWFQHEHPDLVVDRHRVQETETIVH
jgi:hypothetical protein